MTNAAEEFVNLVSRTGGISNIKAAIIYKELYYSDNIETAILDVGYSTKEYTEFMEDLAQIDYRSGFGSQELFGIIWFKDGTWATRGEYDGSEWWEHHKCPDIEEHFRIFENRHGDPKDPSYE
jgi:hypothetical protein